MIKMCAKQREILELPGSYDLSIPLNGSFKKPDGATSWREVSVRSRWHGQLCTAARRADCKSGNTCPCMCGLFYSDWAQQDPEKLIFQCGTYRGTEAILQVTRGVFLVSFTRPKRSPVEPSLPPPPPNGLSHPWMWMCTRMLGQTSHQQGSGPPCCSAQPKGFQHRLQHHNKPGKTSGGQTEPKHAPVKITLSNSRPWARWVQ